jgi:hypothetical protein
MATPSRTDVTALLVDWSKGDQEALNKLMPLVYDELHRLASGYLRNERAGHTLQTTALVHDVSQARRSKEHELAKPRAVLRRKAARPLNEVETIACYCSTSRSYHPTKIIRIC